MQVSSQSEHKGYRCYDPLACHLLISRLVSFIEDFAYFSPSSQDVHLLSPLDTLSVESSRVPIDLISLEPVVSIPLTNPSGTVIATTISTQTLDHEDPPVMTSPPLSPPLPHPPTHYHLERPHKLLTRLTPACTGPFN